MNLVIDFGNTSIKAAIFDDWQQIAHFNPISQIELLRLANDNPQYNILLSSVSNAATHFINLIDNKQRLSVLQATTPVPIVNLYGTPATLGVDRLAAVVGAQYLYPEKDCLVIDAGTCITYDLVDAQGQYHGGSISPGLHMRFKALHNFTAKLPLISETNMPGLIGKNTQEAITTGVVGGLIGEIEWFINAYSEKFDGLHVLMCGGDAKFFETKIKGHIFALPELVLTGLNRILLYNAA